THRAGADLSVAAGAHHRRLSARRLDRHSWPADGTMAVTAGRSAVRGRKPAGSRWQCRQRGRRPCSARRLYAPDVRHRQHDQRDALRQAQLRFHPRLRAGRGGHARGQRDRRASLGSGQQRSGADRLCKSQSGQGHHGLVGGRNLAASQRRAVPIDDGRRHAACAVPRPRPRPERSAGWASAGAVRQHLFLDRAHQVRESARAAVTTATRVPSLPDVPTVGEFVPGYEVSVWFSVTAPRNTPPEIIATLNREINAGLADPKLKARLVELGGAPMPMTPAELGKLITSETEKWAKVIRAANIKPE